MKGFTLIEVLVATAITTVALALVTYFTVDVSRFGVDLGERLELERELELTLRTMLTEVRSMGPGENGAYPIAAADDSSFTFFTDVDGDGSFEQVRYFLDGAVLKKGVIDPIGLEPPSYPVASESLSEVVHYLAPQAPIFEFYPEGYPPETGPLEIPLDISAIRMVKVVGTVDKDPAMPPLPATQAITITIRNLRGEI